MNDEFSDYDFDDVVIDPPPRTKPGEHVADFVLNPSTGKFKMEPISATNDEFSDYDYDDVVIDPPPRTKPATTNDDATD